jgi:hypothetical protein
MLPFFLVKMYRTSDHKDCSAQLYTYFRIDGFPSNEDYSSSHHNEFPFQWILLVLYFYSKFIDYGYDSILFTTQRVCGVIADETRKPCSDQVLAAIIKMKIFFPNFEITSYGLNSSTLVVETKDLYVPSISISDDRLLVNSSSLSTSPEFKQRQRSHIEFHDKSC